MNDFTWNEALIKLATEIKNKDKQIKELEQQREFDMNYFTNQNRIIHRLESENQKLKAENEKLKAELGERG